MGCSTSNPSPASSKERKYLLKQIFLKKKKGSTYFAFTFSKTFANIESVPHFQMVSN
jgi:hypothetical protein